MSPTKAVLLLFALFFVLFGYSYMIEPNMLKVENRFFALDCIESNLSRNVVQISDLHFTGNTKQEKINKIYEKINEIDPSVVFITGDFISDADGINRSADLVRKISGSYPVYAVFGNWDYWTLDSNIIELKKQLEGAGAKVLINEAIDMSVGDENITLLGVDDPHTSANITEDIAEAMKGANAFHNQCNVLLAHSPEIIRRASEKNIDLVLVGHTHGGQVYLPFITDLIIPTNADGRGFVKGLYIVGNTQLYVNRGIGTSIMPLRFLLPPEITSITLN